MRYTGNFKWIMVPLMAVSLTACIFEDCGNCELVTVDADGNVTRSTPMLKCGDELTACLNSSPEYVDGKTIYWDCY